MGPSRFALAVGAVSMIFTATAMGCGGIEEPDLFNSGGSTTNGDGGGSDGRADGGRSDAATKDGAGIDSGNPGAGTVSCSSGDCKIADHQVCCYASDQTGTCTASNSCTGTGAFPIPCDSTQDCTDLGKPGMICCATTDQTGLVVNVECVDPSNCQASNGQTNLCDPNASSPCPNGGTCSASTVSIPGYDICKM